MKETKAKARKLFSIGGSAPFYLTRYYLYNKKGAPYFKANQSKLKAKIKKGTFLLESRSLKKCNKGDY